MTLEAVVTNTGAVEDTFDVAAGGPLAPFATLGTTSVTLGAGAQATLPVTLAGLDAFLQQRSFLLLTATAATNAAITASDASAVDVAARRTVAVRFAPASVVRLGPGSVALDLVVENTGNACDERYLLEVTTSPGIAATIASPPFVVPAGQAAALRLEATAAALGRYDVSVVVTTDTTNPACPPMPPAAAGDEAEVSFVDTLPTTTSTTTSTTTLPTTPDTIPTTSTAVPVTTTSTTVPGLDHFLLYKVKPGAGSPRFAQLAPLTLADRFGSAGYQVVKPKHLGLPADKNGEGVADATTHLVDYQVKAVKGTPAFAKLTDLQIGNQCNTLRLEVSKPSGLLVPALKSLVAPPSSPGPGRPRARSLSLLPGADPEEARGRLGAVQVPEGHPGGRRRPAPDAALRSAENHAALHAGRDLGGAGRRVGSRRGAAGAHRAGGHPPPRAPARLLPGEARAEAHRADRVRPRDDGELGDVDHPTAGEARAAGPDLRERLARSRRARFCQGGRALHPVDGGRAALNGSLARQLAPRQSRRATTYWSRPSSGT